MKRTYETMQAYKIKFNAREQVAAAACIAMEVGGKYGGKSCSFDMGSTNKFSSDPKDPCDSKYDSFTIEYTSAAG